jgi:hypothetical protein
MVHTGTGAVLHAYDTEGEPEGRLLVACGNRRSTRCRACAETYRADTYQLVKAGLVGGKGVPDTVGNHAMVFVTLTAPSFGPVHNRVVAVNGKGKRCHPHGRIRCRRRHRPDDPCLGQPIDTDSYDYAGAVIWNSMAPALWADTTRRIRRQLAAIAGIPQRQFPMHVRVSFAKVAEYQARGSVHFHAIIRLDGPNGPDSTQQVLAAHHLVDAIKTATSTALALSPRSDAIGRPVSIRWGDQLDIEPIEDRGDMNEGQLTDRQVAGYIAKYATKGAEATGTVDSALCCRDCAGSGLAHPKSRLDCPTCAGTGCARDLDTLPTSEHARAMIRACWCLGADSGLAELRLRPWAHMLGFRGHFSTKSRCYSTTMTVLRNARRDYQTARTMAALGLSRDTTVVRQAEARDDVYDRDDPDDDGTVLVIGHWRYAGRGFTAGEAAFANTIAEDIAENRRIWRQVQANESYWDHLAWRYVDEATA